MSEPVKFTEEELREFDRITAAESSQDQMDRITGRLAVRKFLAEHGKEKCDAMFAALVNREKNLRKEARARRKAKGSES